MSSKMAKGDAKSQTAKASTDPLGEFYTKHPYPPPIENLDRARDLWQDENVHRAEFHLMWPDREYRADFDVLVAGCGTWQAAKFALCHPDARVAAIDISTTSLEHTEALKQKYDLTNLEVQELSIENVAELDHQFDMIVCTGVLHHLVDPDAGLRALRSVLRSDGAMYLMLYAPYGRTGVQMFQEYCRKLGVGTSEQEMEDLTHTLQLLPQYHPLVLMVRGSKGSLQAKTLVDALLNPRDRTYSVPQVFDFIERQELTWGRWHLQAPYLPHCGAFAVSPHAARLAALPEREQYQAMELWRGLMTNHDFVVHASGANSEIRFDDERFLRYVPIRRAWTSCENDQLPPGAVGVLINRTHLFNDIYLPVGEDEKAIYEAIDGRRSVAEILETTAKDASLARPFFEKLWHYDQVVFNTSQPQ